jgi:hypothetical protein
MLRRLQNHHLRLLNMAEQMDPQDYLTLHHHRQQMLLYQKLNCFHLHLAH